MMLASALVAFIAQATASIVPVVDAQGFPADETEVLDMEQDQSRRMTTPVMIGEHGPFDFMIDTAAEATVISDKVDSQVKLPSDGQAWLVGMASSRTVELVQLDGLRLGGRVIDGLSAPVLQREHLGADGIIGLDSLEDLRILFDFRSNTIAVYQKGEAPSNRGYEIVVRAHPNHGRMILTDAYISGVRTKVMIDTGAQASIGNSKLREKLRSRIQAETMATDVHGAKIDVELESAKTLKIGNIGLENVVIAYADAPIFKELDLDDEPALILGMEEMRAFDRVAIDFSTRKVMFDIPSRFGRGSEAPATRDPIQT